MGLAFGAIASTRAQPFWQSLIASKQLESPEMAFWMTRFRGTRGAQEEEPGGAFTLGGTNSSLFQGEIEFLDMAGDSTPSFWLLAVQCMRQRLRHISDSDAAFHFSQRSLCREIL
jgi:cathepsin D